MCQKCRKVKLRREFPAETRGAAAEGKAHDLVLCLQCCPEDERYMCTVCKVEKNRRSFPQKTHLSYQVADMRRCLECYTCAGCGEAKEMGTQFDTASKFCSTCYAATQSQTCSICEEKQSTAEFREAAFGTFEVGCTEIPLQRMLHLCGVRAGAEARRAVRGRDTNMPKV